MMRVPLCEAKLPARPDLPDWPDLAHAANSRICCDSLSTELYQSFMTAKLEVSGCYADKNPPERPVQCADLSGSDGSSLRKDSDRQGVALDDFKSGTGGCDGLKETAADGSCNADNLEVTPTRPRSALKVRGLPHAYASLPQKQVSAQRTAKDRPRAQGKGGPLADSARVAWIPLCWFWWLFFPP